jgi:hypothetical protein
MYEGVPPEAEGLEKTTCLLIAAPSPLSGLGGGLINREVIGVAKICLVTQSKLVICPVSYTSSSALEIEDVTEAAEEDGARRGVRSER